MAVKIRSLLHTFLILAVCIACIVLEMSTHSLTAPFTNYLVIRYKSKKAEENQSSIDYPLNDSIDIMTPYQDELNVLRRDGTTYSLRKLKLASLTFQQLALTCHSYLDNTNTVCRRKLRMGHIGDGGWEICDDIEVRPQPPCIIYSFGIADDFSFDDDAAKMYKCHVFSFDPTIAQKSHNRSEHIHFYDIGISHRDYVDYRAYNFSRLSTIRQYLGHGGLPINVIKMDVEGAEWDSIENMLTKSGMSNVDQFLVEYHITVLNRTRLIKYLGVLQGLEQAGFRIFYTHKNEGCGYNIDGYPPITSHCFEVHYKKDNLRKLSKRSIN